LRDVLDHRHPEDGYIKIEYSDGQVRFSCRWPLDRDTDEWISITEDYSKEDYSRAIRPLLESGIAELSGKYASFQIERKTESSVYMRIAAKAGPLPQTLIIPIDKSPESFSLD
jgi:hypothetical protein